MNRLIYLAIFIIVSGNCFSQQIESFNTILKGGNIRKVKITRENRLILLSENNQVMEVELDSLQHCLLYDTVKANSVDFSNWLRLTAIGDTKGQLYYYKGNELISKIQAHNNAIHLIKFSYSGKYLVTSDRDSKIKVWLSASEDQRLEISNTNGLITDIEFSVDEKLLIFSTSTGKVVIWNINDNKELKTYNLPHNGWTRSIAVCPDGLKFAVCGDNRKIFIFSYENDDSYQLTKSHKNIISDIQFINSNYLLSIGHDHRIVMNNINLPADKDTKEHFKGYPRYKGYFHTFSGDKYLSSISISDENDKIAVSSLGKGVMVTNYFHQIIENPHFTEIYEIGNSKTDKTNTASLFHTNKNPCIIKGRITRPDEIKQAWLYFVKDDKKTKLKLDKNGEFMYQVPIFGETSDYKIIVEDWDKNLRNTEHNFTLFLDKE